MSRTIRFRKNKFVPWWNNYSHKEWIYIKDNEEINPEWELRLYPSWRECSIGLRFERKLTGKNAKKVWWKSHKDDKFNFKEPGPRMWRNIFDRKNRRRSKRELQKFILNSFYEPIIYKRGKSDYWT